MEASDTLLEDMGARIAMTGRVTGTTIDVSLSFRSVLVVVVLKLVANGSIITQHIAQAITHYCPERKELGRQKQSQKGFISPLEKAATSGSLANGAPASIILVSAFTKCGDAAVISRRISTNTPR